jgi:hypothetical protein
MTQWITVIGKHHPSCYHLGRDIRKEQENTQEEITEAEAGGKVRKQQGMTMTVFWDAMQCSLIETD